MIAVAEAQEKKIYRCAIYTRKSTEKNLEIEFNSLDAQKEAAENFIASQKMNGWQLLPDKYDDGGYSGGNIERPALKRLLADIEAGKIDIVVIYKLDRLSRSLLDFMKLVEMLEQHNVSFVSVTQDINTSTSAGRMMLNILMTFSEYERLVIAERILDSVAGAKKRGKFCGGTLVLGYDLEPKTKRLIINEKEAELVRHIFKRYGELGSAKELAKELNSQGHHPKTWITRKGKIHHCGEFGTAHIYRMLSNPIYIGLVVHKDKTFPGEHKAIIDEHTWEMTHALLEANTRALRRSKSATTYPLRGLIRCGYCGGGMTTVYTKKGNRRYIYLQCVKDSKRAESSCPLRQVSGENFEKAVLQQLGAIFRTPSLLAGTYEAARKNEKEENKNLLAKREELTKNLESLRQKMFQVSDTASHDELKNIKTEMEKAGSELKEVKNYLQILSAGPISHSEITGAFNNIETLWEELFPAEKYRLAHLFFEKITIRNDRMEMEIKTNGVTALVKELNALNEERKMP